MMTAADLMRRAGILLQDEENLRWPLSERAEWINEAVRAICLAKPSAASKSIVLALQNGTLQKVPTQTYDNGDLPLALVRLIRNIDDALRPHNGGAIITIAGRSALDAQEPFWHSPNYNPFQREVVHYLYDEANPLEYYVYPGNDGTGHVEAVIAYCPAPVQVANAPDNIASWNTPIGLPEPYSVPILDYMLFRALIKDDVTGNAGRAAAHLQLFQASLGTKIQIEGAASPNTSRVQQQ